MVRLLQALVGRLDGVDRRRRGVAPSGFLPAGHAPRTCLLTGPSISSDTHFERSKANGGGVRTDSQARESESHLRDFDKTAELVRPFVVDQFGVEAADALFRGARENFEEIIPQIPRIEGIRARMLNSFLRITAQEVAVYKAVNERGGTPAEAWEICHEAIRLRMVDFPKWKRWLSGRLMYSGIVRRIIKRREENNEQAQFGDFEVRYRTGRGSDFDIGIDYVRCGNLDLAKKLGAEEFAPYVCMSDIALSDALGWGLIRTQTLADGCSHCDFRFKRNSETRISSKTPDVQRIIEKIDRRSRST